MSALGKILYSVIIPHKNSPDILAYCLSTIPVRDDVQVIVVDDNSDADKVDFENFPKWKGVHYECYFTKEGKGAGYARNVGLEHAKGKWVLFVDADDFLLPTIGEIMDREVNTDVDIIYFRPKAVLLADRHTETWRADKYNNQIDEYQRIGNEHILRVGFIVPWSKFFKRLLIENNHIRFEEIKYSNDMFFSTHAGCAASKIDVRDDSYYVVTKSENTLTSADMNKDGEAEIRAGALIRACIKAKELGQEPDFKSVSIVISTFLLRDLKRYRVYFKTLMNLGYSKWFLTRTIFNSPKWKARTWRRIYSLCATCGL